MKATKTHEYRGQIISPVVWQDKANQGYRWYWQQYHSPTGMMYDSQECPHYYTLADAREAIDHRLDYI